MAKENTLKADKPWLIPLLYLFISIAFAYTWPEVFFELIDFLSLSRYNSSGLALGIGIPLALLFLVLNYHSKIAFEVVIGIFVLGICISVSTIEYNVDLYRQLQAGVDLTCLGCPCSVGKEAPCDISGSIRGSLMSLSADLAGILVMLVSVVRSRFKVGKRQVLLSIWISIGLFLTIQLYSF